VAVEGNVVLAGAPYAFTTRFDAPGRVFAYVKPSTGWASTSTPNLSLTPSDKTNTAFFGGAVAFSGKFVVVGAQNSTVNGNLFQGAAYIFGPKP
jgi:FG-GAP repeat protein